MVGRHEYVEKKREQSPKQISQRLERLKILKQTVVLSRESFANTFEVQPVCNILKVAQYQNYINGIYNKSICNK